MIADTQEPARYMGSREERRAALARTAEAAVPTQAVELRRLCLHRQHSRGGCAHTDL